MRAIRSTGAQLGVLCAAGLLGLAAAAHAEPTKRLGQHEGVRVYRGLDHKSGFKPPDAPPKIAPIAPGASVPTLGPPIPALRPKERRADGLDRPHLRRHLFGPRDFLIHRTDRFHGGDFREHRPGDLRHPHFRRRGIPNRG